MRTADEVKAAVLIRYNEERAAYGDPPVAMLSRQISALIEVLCTPEGQPLFKRTASKLPRGVQAALSEQDRLPSDPP
jgi:hypothetical protein